MNSRLTLLLLILASFGWVFSGWPRILNFPPEIQEARAATATYDFSSCGSTCDTSTDWQAFADDVDVFRFGGSTSNRNDHVEADDTQFTAISSSNDSRWTSDDPGLSDEILFWSEMKISESPSAISNIDLVWEGFLTGGSSATFSIWVLTSGSAYQTDASWTQVGTNQTISGTSDTTMTRSITSNFSNYIGADGILTWVVYESVSSQSLNTDYVKAVVTYTNNAPTITVSQPDGVSDTVTAGTSYNITYDLADTDNTVTAAFYYDADSSGLNGTAISGACASAAEGSGATCSWDTTGVTPGSYYVYGITNDGVNPAVSDYSSGQITINAAPVYSVSITSSGTISYGFVELSTATSTVGNGYTQTALNDGNTTAKFNVRSSDTTGGTTWTLASSIGSNTYKHEFSTTTGSTWTVMPDSSTYVLADPNVTESETVTFDFRLTVPSGSSDYQEKSITITVQAEAP